MKLTVTQASLIQLIISEYMIAEKMSPYLEYAYIDYRDELKEELKKKLFNKKLTEEQQLDVRIEIGYSHIWLMLLLCNEYLNRKKMNDYIKTMVEQLMHSLTNEFIKRQPKLTKEEIEQIANPDYIMKQLEKLGSMLPKPN